MLLLWISQLVTCLLCINWHIRLFCVLNTPTNIFPLEVSKVILSFKGKLAQLLNRSKLHSIAYILDETLLINVIIFIDTELSSSISFCPVRSYPVFGGNFGHFKSFWSLDKRSFESLGVASVRAYVHAYVRFLGIRSLIFLKL